MNKSVHYPATDTPAERFRQVLEAAGCEIRGELNPDMTAADVIKAAESMLEQIRQQART